MLTRALVLLTPALLGALAGGLRLFERPDAAVGHLNRYALYVAFPALVFVGLADASFALPAGGYFYLVVPAALGLSLTLVRLVGRGPERGSLALVASFGNVAYLGLPLVEQTFGASALGVASLAVAVHVTLAMLLGPWLLLRWGRAPGGARRGTGALLRQPLLWAPFAGLLARRLPDHAAAGLLAVLRPIGASAAPVALFLLGLYLHTHAAGLRKIERATVAHVATKLLLLPAVTLALCGLGRGFGWLRPLDAQVLVLLSAMPAAITTFAIAQELGVGVARVTQTVVASSFASLAPVPLVLWFAAACLGPERPLARADSAWSRSAKGARACPRGEVRPTSCRPDRALSVHRSTGGQARALAGPRVHRRGSSSGQSARPSSQRARDRGRSPQGSQVCRNASTRSGSCRSPASNTPVSWTCSTAPRSSRTTMQGSPFDSGSP